MESASGLNLKEDFLRLVKYILSLIQNFISNLDQIIVSTLDFEMGVEN